ncbi:MAG: UDP-N-acetylmuramoyl-tripeptide--D-alanyl-D-alanine ligase [Porticoccaceae bacterium]|nr:UDP-N-acetylmuramoyl-tripeptide--D-alanyl-D-alanine ligase [Porticoccaceae bacterium]
MNLTELAALYGGTLVNPGMGFSAVSIDSRSIKPGDLFVAIEGDNFDGHTFLNNLSDVASGAVVSKYADTLNIPQWVVQDTTKALGDIARYRRDQFLGSLIALTGSSGKTSVKDAIAMILSQTHRVHATSGNLNNHYGVPLTLLEIDQRADIAVIEMGASAVGEIDYLCSVAKPDVALVNNAQSAHIEGFGSLEAIADAKAEIYACLGPAGIAVVNIDQPWVDKWLSIIGDRSYLSFSVSDAAANIFAEDIYDNGDGYFCFKLVITPLDKSACEKSPVTLKIPGRHSVSNSLAAAACAYAVGINIAQIVNGLEQLRDINGRLQQYKISENFKLIDDTYNANLDSFKAAIDVLACAKSHRILVMGDMGELGEQSVAMHQQVGQYAKKSGVNTLYTVGSASQHACAEFGGSHFSDKNTLLMSLVQQVEKFASNGDSLTVLIKGSRSANMEFVVNGLINGDKALC